MFHKLLREAQFHGGKRLAEKKYGLFWNIVLIPLFCLSVYVVLCYLRRFFNDPTYTVRYETVNVNTNFPAVFVCPSIIFREDKVNRFFSRMKIPPHLNETYLKTIVYAYVSSDIVYNLEDLLNLEEFLEYNDITTSTAAVILTSSCKEMLHRCYWNNKEVNCSDLFRMKLTGRGYCCVFNSRALKRDTSLKYQKVWTTQRSGFMSGLALVLNERRDHIDTMVEYKYVVIQTSQYYIEPYVDGTLVTPGHERWFSFSTENSKLASRVKKMDDHMLKCQRVSNHLKYYPEYNKDYCLVECEIARMIKMCQCVRWLHPPVVKFCRAHQIECMRRARVSFKHTNNKVCDCSVACERSTKIIQTYHFELKPDAYPLDPFYEGLNFTKKSIIRVFMDRHSVQKNKETTTVYTPTDFFAQIGGILGCFFGCSILTILELTMILIYGLIYLYKKMKVFIYGHRKEQSKKMNKYQRRAHGRRYKNNNRGYNRKRGHFAV